MNLLNQPCIELRQNPKLGNVSGEADWRRRAGASRWSMSNAVLAAGSPP